MKKESLEKIGCSQIIEGDNYIRFCSPLTKMKFMFHKDTKELSMIGSDHLSDKDSLDWWDSFQFDLAKIIEYLTEV